MNTHAQSLGRPRDNTVARRSRELLRLLADGRTLTDATVTAGLSPLRVVKLLDDEPFRAAVVAVMAKERAA